MLYRCTNMAAVGVKGLNDDVRFSGLSSVGSSEAGEAYGEERLHAPDLAVRRQLALQERLSDARPDTAPELQTNGEHNTLRRTVRGYYRGT